MKTADSLVASLEKLRHRRSHLRSCELAIVNRAFTIPYSEWGIEIGEKEDGSSMSMSAIESLGKILVDIRQPHYLETYGDGEAESHEPPPALQALLTLLDTTTGLSAAAKSMILQEVVLLQMANKTANLESVLSKVSALLPSKDDDMAHWTAERVLKLWEPFINLLHDNDHYKHALPSTWLDFERVRRPLVAMYRAASTPTPASAPAVGHVDATLCYLSSLNPSLRLLCRLLRSMLAAKGVLVHFVQALNVTHGETLYTEIVPPSPEVVAALDLESEDNGGHANIDLVTEPIMECTAKLHSMLERFQAGLFQTASSNVIAHYLRCRRFLQIFKK